MHVDICWFEDNISLDHNRQKFRFLFWHLGFWH